jgi:hypothetical protein
MGYTVPLDGEAFERLNRGFGCVLCLQIALEDVDVVIEPGGNGGGELPRFFHWTPRNYRGILGTSPKTSEGEMHEGKGSVCCTASRVINHLRYWAELCTDP